MRGRRRGDLGSFRDLVRIRRRSRRFLSGDQPVFFMNPAAAFNDTYLAPSLAWFAPVCPIVPVTPATRLLLLAIAGQESNWKDRIQGGNGPAHSFWQMERLGGVTGVMTHATTKSLAKACCDRVPVAFNSTLVWGMFAAKAGDDLACAFARLLLWSDPMPLPPVGDEEGAFEYYIRLWRPGKPSRSRWSLVYPDSLEVIVSS